MVKGVLEFHDDGVCEVGTEVEEICWSFNCQIVLFLLLLIFMEGGKVTFF